MMSPRDILKSHDWADTIQKVGVGTAVAFAVLWGVGSGLQWIGKEVVKPFVVDQIATSAVLRQQIPIQTESIQKIVAVVEKVAIVVEKVAANQDAIVATQKQSGENQAVTLTNQRAIILQGTSQIELLEDLRITDCEQKAEHKAAADILNVLKQNTTPTTPSPTAPRAP